MSCRRDRRVEGFTIVELLVVIGILGLLIGLLLPALSGAQKKSRKLKELNALKQVDLAWRLYANSSADRAVPGFLETGVQRRWKVSFEYRNRILIPPAPSFSGGDMNVAGPWTWRLLPFLDYNYSTVLGYQDDVNDMRFYDSFLGVDLPRVDVDVFDLEPGSVTPSMVVSHADAIAQFPAFGYNAFYVGGWWEMIGDQPRYRHFDATVDGRAATLVETGASRIERSSEVITFCSSSFLPPGTYRRLPRNQLGAHYVTPSYVGQTSMWSPAEEGDPTVLQVNNAEAAPIGRYNGLVAVLHADGHTGLETPWSLLDMRRWIDGADHRNFRHD